MSMIQEFKEFALKGNVIDLAVGVIIGGAFGKIVNSVIEDLIMPVVGRAIGNVDFSNLYYPLSKDITAGMPLAKVKELGLPAFGYGNFLTIAFNFAILAFCIFMLVKAMNKLKKKEEAKPAPVAEVPADVKLLTEIRDLLKK